MKKSDESEQINSKSLSDPSLLIFDLKKQDVHAGGSGCACCGTVMCSKILNDINNGKLNRVLVVATGALLSAYPETSFVEIFCPVWTENKLFLSHMGEMNTALTAEKAKLMLKPMKYSDIDTTWLCGTYKAGAATLMDLAPLADGKFRVIVSYVEMKVPECEKFRCNSTCGWFEPNGSIATFLENYSKLGGTHHLMLMYGDMRGATEAFAKTMGYEYCEI